MVNYDADLEQVKSSLSRIYASNISNANDSPDYERVKRFIDYNQKANDYLREENYGQSMKAIEKAIELYNPSTDDCIYSEYKFLSKVATIYGCNEEIDKALQYYNAAIEKCPSSEVDLLMEDYYCYGRMIYESLFLKSIENFDDPIYEPKTQDYHDKAAFSARRAFNLLDSASEDMATSYRVEITLLLAAVLAFTSPKDANARNAYAEAKCLAQAAKDFGDTSGKADEILDICNATEEDQLKSNQDDTNPSASASGGCYIATAVYGSYDCPQVWTLRRFRDFWLKNTAIGRLFIKLYYWLSPKMVKKFGNSKLFRIIFRITLDNLVSRLKRKGYDDSKYYD